jgi:hypothetical protein
MHRDEGLEKLTRHPKRESSVYKRIGNIARNIGQGRNLAW